jgi:ABC-2 type transport system permease protein
VTAAAAAPAAGSVETGLGRDSLLIFRRMVREGNRQAPIAYVFPLMMTAVGLVLFSQLLKQMNHLPAFPAKTYADWLLPGGVLLPGMMGAGFTAISLAKDVESTYFERLRLVPAPPFSHVVGRLLFEALRILPAAVVILLAAQAQGAHIKAGPLGFLALVVLSGVWALAYNGLFLAVALKAGNAQGPQGLLPMFGPLSFVSSLWIPVKYMPAWARHVALANPLTHVIEFGRMFTTGHYTASVVLWGAVSIVGVFAFAQLLTSRTLAGRLAGE